jgi:hypothetical protein
MKFELLYHFRILRHYFLSRSKFELHSPFVYKIYSEILKDKTNYPEYHTLREEMVTNSKVSFKSHRLLFRLSRYFKPKTILIIGKKDEIKCSYLTLGSPGSRLINFHENLSLMADPAVFDMVIVAGDLSKVHLLDYFSRIMQHIHNDSVLIFNNMHSSREMIEAWNEIKNHPSVTLTIDLFHTGLVFYKEELSKEDFILRY